MRILTLTLKGQTRAALIEGLLDATEQLRREEKLDPTPGRNHGALAHSLELHLAEDVEPTAVPAEPELAGAAAS